jgi:enoyl-CoA hydratase/carnithine racemase
MPASTTVRPLPAGVRARLDKLMLMLGSPTDGERAAAAGLITNLLKEHGLDWHDLVGSIGQPAAAPQPAPTKAKPQSGPQTMTAADLKRAVHKILRSPINERSRRFLAGLQDRADIYGFVKFSDKQWQWLCDLAWRAKVHER